MRKFNITVNGVVYEVEVEELNEATGTPVAQPMVKAAKPAKPASRPSAKPAAKPAPKKPAPVASAGAETIASPMPGVILDVKATEGQAVKKGEVLLILEAMKMENEIMAPRDGVVEQIAVAKGTNVNAGQVLVIIK